MLESHRAKLDEQPLANADGGVEGSPASLWAVLAAGAIAAGALEPDVHVIVVIGLVMDESSR